MGVVTGVFQFPNGSPVANAAYQWKLSGDAIEFTGTSACVCPPIVNGSLDANGSMTQTLAFNDVLSTTAGATTYYQLSVKAQNGGQVWNEFYYLTGTAANLNIIPPAGIPVVITTPVGNILLQTNSVTNPSQTKLNVLNGPGVSASADGVGGVTFSANLVAGTNITLTTSTANAITITSTGGGSSIPSGVRGALTSFGDFAMGQSFWNAVGGIAAINVGTASAVQCSLLVCPVNMTVTTLTLYWGTTANVGHHNGFALYSFDGNTKLIDGSDILPNNASLTVCATTFAGVNLTPGAYWWAQSADVNNQSGWRGQVLQLNDQTKIVNAQSVKYGVATSKSTAGVMPASLGAITAMPLSITVGIVLGLLE